MPVCIFGYLRCLCVLTAQDFHRTVEVEEERERERALTLGARLGLLEADDTGPPSEDIHPPTRETEIEIEVEIETEVYLLVVLHPNGMWSWSCS